MNHSPWRDMTSSEWDMAARMNQSRYGPDDLTPGEMAVLAAVAEEAEAPVPTQAAARRLHLSMNTVRSHLVHIYSKLGVHSLIGAFRRLGWLRK